jgi:PAS domain S-box-containing protein
MGQKLLSLVRLPLYSLDHLSLATFLVFVVYMVSAKIGLASAVVHPNATAIWPPTGIALAALILFGYPLWPGIFLGALLANITTAGSIWTSTSIAIGNTLEAVAGAYLVNRFAGGRQTFDRPQDVLKFAALAGLTSTALSATIGVTTLYLGGSADFSHYDEIWFTWWLGDMGGALVLAPLLILWGLNPRFSLQRQELWERLVSLAVLIVVGYLAFARFPLDFRTSSVAFLIVPILLWAAVRYGGKEATAAVFVASTIAVCGTINGYGPFIRQDPNESLLLLQLFGGMVALMTLMLSAAICSRNRSEAARRRSEETARCNLAELQAIYRSVPVGLGLTDRDLRFLSVNETLAEINGISVSDHIGRTLREVVPEALAQKVEPLYRRVMETGEPALNVTVHGDTKAVTPGVTRIWNVNYHPVCGDEGAITGVSIMIQDITERKLAEEKLAQAARRRTALYHFVEHRAHAESFQELYDAALKAILSALGCDRAAILLRDEAGTMKFVSSHGLSEPYQKAVEGHSPWQSDDPNPSPVYIPEVASAEMNGSLKALIVAEGIGALAFIPVLLEGKLGGKFMTYYNAPHDFNEAELALSLTIAHQLAHGITRMQAEKALRESDQRKDDFLAMLGHELRNPLGVISTVVQLLRMKSLPVAQVTELQDAVELEVKQMARLLDDLLDISRIARGMIRLEKETCDFAAIVREVAETRRHMLQEKGLELTVIVPEQSLWVIGDRTRLAQVVGNLLDNANKFSETAGRVTVELLEERSTSNAALTVRDTGIGFEPETLSQLFEPFVQVDKTLDRTRGGLGLGLALVKGLVELHGGQVTGSSEGLECGAEFTVRIPLAQQPRVGDRRTEPAAGVAEGRRILVVEDNPMAARTLSMFLTQTGHAVEVAHNGIDGARIAHSFQPQVVMCDLGLPGMDGYEVARTLRREADFCQTCLIAVSGYGQESDKTRALEAGFNMHMTKPINLKELAAVLSGLSLVRH